MAPVQLRQSNVFDILLWILRFRKRYRVTGTSMTPVLRPGDHVLVDMRPSAKANLAVGDVVLARHPYMRNVQILKVLSEITADGRYRLRGTDSVESTDSSSFGLLDADRILGQVSCRLSRS
jgi:nickel-type superoxide dismutase maturation protease